VAIYISYIWDLCCSEKQRCLRSPYARHVDLLQDYGCSIVHHNTGIHVMEYVRCIHYYTMSAQTRNESIMTPKRRKISLLSRVSRD
jgi:hypothetical protein